MERQSQQWGRIISSLPVWQALLDRDAQPMRRRQAHLCVGSPPLSLRPNHLNQRQRRQPRFSSCSHASSCPEKCTLLARIPHRQSRPEKGTAAVDLPFPKIEHQTHQQKSRIHPSPPPLPQTQGDPPASISQTPLRPLWWRYLSVQSPLGKGHRDSRRAARRDIETRVSTDCAARLAWLLHSVADHAATSETNNGAVHFGGWKRMANEQGAFSLPSPLKRKKEYLKKKKRRMCWFSGITVSSYLLKKRVLVCMLIFV